MADGKWVPDLTPETPLVEAARRVLELRLRVIAHWLPMAVAAAEKDAEHVHQLRVGTRRADAALRLFRRCLPGKAYRKARCTLQRIRQAAGEARDWDVFLLALAERVSSAPEAQRAGLDFLIGHALGQREVAQGQLAALTEDAKGFADFAAGVVGALRPAEGGEAEQLGDLARAKVAAAVERLGQSARGDLGQYDRLHDVRIDGKRLRYTIEVVADCFEPGMKEILYPQIEEMQEILGRANDSHIACQRLMSLRRQAKRWPATWARAKAGVEALLRFHQRRLPEERKRFEEWWRAWEQAGVEAFIGV